MAFKNMRIGVRLAWAFASITILICVTAFTGWTSLTRADQEIKEIVQHNNRKAALLNSMIDDLNIVASAVRNYLLYEDEAMRTLQRERVAKARQEFNRAFAELERLARTDRERQRLGPLAQLRDSVRPLFNQVFSMVDAGQAAEGARFLRNSVQAPQDRWFAEMYALIEEENAQTREAVTHLQATFDTAERVLATVLLVSVVVAVCMAMWITRSITAPLGQAVAVARTVAAGDLSTHIEVASRDETGELMAALRDMNGSLVKIVGEVQQGTHVIASAATQIAMGNMDLSSRTNEQAAALEETASSMEELTSTVRQNADNAQQANQLALSASAIAQQGGSLVGQVVDTMETINASARRIVDIIAVIDGIAFQTNILALNAAVEAARAGEQGRGFAVVASEVRNLAQRAAAAAKEIKTLIDDSVEKVASGTELVAQAGNTMRDLVDSVGRVTGIIGEISVASLEQSAGIEQTNRAVTHMDGFTQQNAALVEEAAAAAGALQEQADGLSRLVGQFKVARTPALLQ